MRGLWRPVGSVDGDVNDSRIDSLNDSVKATYDAIIGQFGKQVAKQPFVMSDASIVQKYDPFPETNSIQTYIKFL